MIKKPMACLLSENFAGEWGSEGKEGMVAVLRTANFTPSGHLDYSNPAWREIASAKIEMKRMYKGDVILEKSGGTPNRPVGIPALFDSDDVYLCSNFNQVLRFDKKQMLGEYAFHQLRWLHSKGAFTTYTRKTTGLQNLQMKKFTNLEMQVPPIETQQRAVNSFKQIDTLLTGHAEALKRLDELIKSRFIEMFERDTHYPTVAVEELLSGIVSGTNVGGEQRILANNEYAVLKISAVTKGWFKADEYKVVNDVDGIKMIHPCKGDLLFSRANTSDMVGATAIVDADYSNLFLPDKLWRIDPAPNVNAIFLKHLLSSTKQRAEMSKVATGTSGSMQNISMKKFRRIPAFLPPLPLQQEFADFVAQVDKLKLETQQSIDKLQMLYDSLAQEYFSV